MMFQSKVPQNYWVEAFFTANFLINLLLSSISSTKCSPYEALNGHAPDYTTLRMFGCACYPTLHDYAYTKFDPRSLKCVFLGYNKNYKGYRCLLPTIGRFYISRHVIFDEYVFPFATIHFSLQLETISPLIAAWQKSFTPTSSTNTKTDVATMSTPCKLSNLQLKMTLHLC